MWLVYPTCTNAAVTSLKFPLPLGHDDRLTVDLHRPGLVPQPRNVSAEADVDRRRSDAVTKIVRRFAVPAVHDGGSNAQPQSARNLCATEQTTSAALGMVMNVFATVRTRWSGRGSRIVCGTASVLSMPIPCAALLTAPSSNRECAALHPL